MLQITSASVGKLAQSIAGQTHAGEAWTNWASNSKLHSMRVWIHAASVGEGILAEPVLTRLARSSVGPMTVIRTFTSPSAAGWSGSFAYDRSDYLPSTRSLAKLFHVFQPTLMVYPRADLWPTVVRLAKRVNVPQVVIGGQIRPRSRRLKWPMRNLNNRLVRDLTAIGAVSETDMEQWVKLGATRDLITITGDPRDTAVIERVSDLSWATQFMNWADGDFVLLAGSTLERDDTHVIRAAANIPGRTIIVPHEPSNTTIHRLCVGCKKNGLTHSVLDKVGELPLGRAKVVIVGAVGGLQDLYAAASVALVGGGFSGDRLHSTSEPAAVGVPILFGPGGASDPSASRFLPNGGARIVNDAAEIVTACVGLRDDRLRRETGLRARTVLDAGAATKTADLILSVLNR